MEISVTANIFMGRYIGIGLKKAISVDLYTLASAFGMEISAEKSKIMVTPATNENNTNIPITVNGSINYNP